AMSDEVRILDGATFVISDAAGDVRGGTRPDGLFHRDVRHLSCWQIRVDGSVLPGLAGPGPEPDPPPFYLLEHDGSVHDLAMLSLRRDRRLDDGMRERLTLNNWSREDRPLVVTLRFAADFADVFEVKAGCPSERETSIEVRRDEVTIAYTRDDY